MMIYCRTRFKYRYPAQEVQFTLEFLGYVFNYDIMIILIEFLTLYYMVHVSELIIIGGIISKCLIYDW